ncbi:TetR/AcrR family transcriptional regulator C-terminal domain-containing protein [Lentzea sp. NBC_00516]|uniref:TetR/AcrR family transcriptional regulator n=1 Tax=Lentzea sp. NBC_00516 TaxID=2903582 RepID=UPI002E7FDF8C|nr:TetR/AcrR family transcriptional regulator C-terminal domain-containing protein [Lentzea sp. NBC_00516]WUD23817.1 TetR/AcrR family transcriptional regulator C-terminal domain-containing protein [Lentzea sp. NBC_00516]
MDSVWFSKPRPSSGQPLGLSRETIVRKAMQMLDEHGLQKLSMRKLAAELGAAPMSLYWHVPTKDALIELCLDEVYGEFPLPGPDDDWETAVRGMMHALRHLAHKHPWWVRGIGEFNSIGPKAVAMSDSMFEPMLRSGLSLPAAAQSVSTVSSYVVGYSIAEVNFIARGGMDSPPPDLTKIADLYREKHPNYVRMLDEQEIWSLEGQFEFGLDCVIDGIKARVAALR